jgi:pyridoxal 5'-phosphate synthase pdxS subunit
MMRLGAESVFVGSGIFKSSDPERRARAIVMATTHFRDPQILAQVSSDLGEAMAGLEISKLAPDSMLQNRGW